MLKRFHQLLLDYYAENKQLSLGVPSVQYCASELAYSPRYLGDLIHKATGGTAIGHIHSFVIERGKSLLMHGHNISETAHLLGFGYTPLQPDFQERNGPHPFGIPGEISLSQWAESIHRHWESAQI